VGLLAGGAALALAARLMVAGGAVADGVIIAEPYRFLCPPAEASARNQQPQPKTQMLDLQNGKSPPIAFTSDEAGVPQVELLLQGGSLTVPKGATAVTVAAKAVRPPETLPSDGGLDGNVYEITVTFGDQPAVPVAGQPITVVLRGPAGAGSPNVERFAEGRWSALSTIAVGAPDTYAGQTPGFGTFALVIPGAPGFDPCTEVGSSSSTSSPGGGGEGAARLLTLVLVLVAVVAVLGGVAVRRLRRG